MSPIDHFTVLIYVLFIVKVLAYLCITLIYGTINIKISVVINSDEFSEAFRPQNFEYILLQCGVTYAT